MSYAQGDLIEATDYNNLINGSNQLNTVWSTGTGNAGYGQTAVSTVAVGSLITATQWTSLINTLNSALTHQSGSGSGIATVTSGQRIDWLSTLQTNITTAYTNRVNANATGTAVTGTSLTTAWTITTVQGTNPGTATRAFGARATFASADQARYFFNAGGRLAFVCSSTGTSPPARNTAVNNVVGYIGGVSTFRTTTNGGRTGTGGTLNTNDTTIGYYDLTTANATIVAATSLTTNYTSDTATLLVRSNGPQGSNSDTGTQVDFWLVISSTSGGNAGGSFDDNLSVTIARQIDVTYPSTTSLSNTWGAVSITSI
jgi:hypothetical protein